MPSALSASYCSMNSATLGNSSLLEDARVHLGVDQYRAERRVGEQLSLPEAIALTDKVLEAVATTAIS